MTYPEVITAEVLAKNAYLTNDQVLRDRHDTFDEIEAYDQLAKGLEAVARLPGTSDADRSLHSFRATAYRDTNRDRRAFVDFLDRLVNERRRLANEAMEARIAAERPNAKTTLTDGSPVTADHREIEPATGMQKGYVVLSAEERAKGFVRPVRRSYIHSKCKSMTTMGVALAETYARDPKFYGATFCATCREHFPVGPDGEFTWADTNEKVGT